MFLRIGWTVMDRKRIVFTWGRFNPPTIGHLKLIEAVAKEANKDDYAIIPTRSHDAKKNPLDIDSKLKWMHKIFPTHAKNIYSTKDINIIIKVMQSFQGDYTDVCLVVGSDRVNGFDTMLKKYNMDPNDPDKKVEYAFRGIEVKSAGERDPDNDNDVSGVSASKMRAHALDKNVKGFMEGIPDTLTKADKLQLMIEIRKGMGKK